MSSSGSPKARLNPTVKGATVELIEGLTAEIQQLNTRLEEEHQARLQQEERHEKEMNELNKALGWLSAEMASVSLSQTTKLPVSNICANCGSPDHRMDHCLKVPEGVLHGCILCNDMGHDTDECAVFAAMSLKEQVQLLVFQRGRMPALRTEKPWAEWLREWCARPESREDDMSFIMPARFPWSKAFTIRLACQSHGHDCEALQKEYDQHNDVTQLPEDPVTTGFPAVP